MAGHVLGGRPHIQHQDLTASQPGGQLITADDLSPPGLGGLDNAADGLAYPAGSLAGVGLAGV